ncbi:MAG: type III polyketide synthase [Planctomycetes bacterium]|nr:type III polyketide synthase [Planctomycetota bacterium]
MKIAGVGSAFPKFWYDQPTLTRALLAIWDGDPAVQSRLPALHANTKVDGRHLCLPLEEYARPRTFTEWNADWLRCALELGEQAVTAALRDANLRPQDVDAIFFSTVTGLASPSLEARLMNKLPFRSDCRRIPMFGLGCVAGAAAIARATDFVRGSPKGVVLVLTVELCSLTLQTRDRSVANLISSGLFGDGASAAVVVGPERRSAGPEVVATRSVFYPDTEDVMGWQIGAHGFQITLSADVPVVARERLPADVDAFLRDLGRTRADIRSWVCHPGGPKVLQAMQDGLGLAHDDLRCSWEHLRRAGNLSSASVLKILQDTIATRRPAAGELGILLAMGPGFCSELLLLRW